MATETKLSPADYARSTEYVRALMDAAIATLITAHSAARELGRDRVIEPIRARDISTLIVGARFIRSKLESGR